jgi:hypothetical protein
MVTGLSGPRVVHREADGEPALTDPRKTVYYLFAARL